MDDISLNEEILNSSNQELGTLKDSYSTLKSSLNSVSINNSELTTAYLLEESKEIINSFFSPIESLCTNVNNILTLIKEKFCNVFFPNLNIETEDGKENIRVMPLYDQTDYPHIKYGSGTIASSGCGITCMAMVASYFTGEEWLPDECAALGNKIEGHQVDNVGRMLTAADKIGLTYEQKTTNDLMPALQNGDIVIALVNDSGHFVVLKGLTEDGKVLVNDPYGPWQDEKDQTGQNLTFSEWGYIQQNDINLTSGRIWVFDGKQSNRFKYENTIEI